MMDVWVMTRQNDLINSLGSVKLGKIYTNIHLSISSYIRGIFAQKFYNTKNP